MKALITIFILLVAVYLFTQLVGFYNRTARPQPQPGWEQEAAPASVPRSAGEESLSGLPPYLEASLAEAQQQGPEALGKWLKTWSKQVKDPRLAAIELDYIVLLNLKDHDAARDLFHQLQARVRPKSPVYPRIQKLAPAYER